MKYPKLYGTVRRQVIAGVAPASRSKKVEVDIRIRVESSRARGTCPGGRFTDFSRDAARGGGEPGDPHHPEPWQTRDGGALSNRDEKSYIGGVHNNDDHFTGTMETTSVTAIQAIQAVLAPALGVSAVGLLLLGLSNRYSTIINRLRLLNDEHRRFSRILGEKGELSYTDSVRHASIQHQKEELLARSRLVRHGILAMQAAVAFFVLTSAAIGITLISSAQAVQTLPLLLFIAGMLSVFVGVAFSALEVYRSFRIVLLEAKAEE